MLYANCSSWNFQKGAMATGNLRQRGGMGGGICVGRLSAGLGQLGLDHSRPAGETCSQLDVEGEKLLHHHPALAYRWPSEFKDSTSDDLSLPGTQAFAGLAAGLE